MIRTYSRESYKQFLGIFVAIFFIWLIFRKISVEDFLISYVGLQIYFIYLALFTFLLGYASRIQRWRLMLAGDNSNLTFLQCSGPFFLSIAMNNILPLRAGDAYRAVGFNKILNIATGTSIATLFVERLLDIMMLIFFFVSTLYLFNIEVVGYPILRIFAFSFITATIFLISLYMIIPKVFSNIFQIVIGKIARHFPALAKKILDECIFSTSTLRHLMKKDLIFYIFIYSFLVWFFEGLTFMLTALAIVSILNPMTAWFAFPVSTLSTLLPGTPGYIGTFDFFIMQAMVELGNERNPAVGFAFLIHIIVWLPPTIIGGAYYLWMTIKKFKENS
jgi:uncharacterized protein (TIRG00374 family)